LVEPGEVELVVPLDEFDKPPDAADPPELASACATPDPLIRAAPTPSATAPVPSHL
jgi:hypothetical protein